MVSDIVMISGQEEEKKHLNKGELQTNKGFEAMLAHLTGGTKKSKFLQWNFSIFNREICIEIAVNKKRS